MIVNIVVNYRCKQKLLKKTETEKQYTFCHIFVIGDIPIGGTSPLPPLPGYAYGALCHMVNPTLVIALRS